MKHFQSLLFISVFLVCGMIGWGSCRNTKFKIARGTTYAVVYIGLETVPRGPFLAKYSTKGVIDSAGNAVQDTSWSIRDAVDTGRDAKGKPIYDSVKKQWTRGA